MVEQYSLAEGEDVSGFGLFMGPNVNEFFAEV